MSTNQEARVYVDVGTGEGQSHPPIRPLDDAECARLYRILTSLRPGEKMTMELPDTSKISVWRKKQSWGDLAVHVQRMFPNGPGRVQP